MILDISKIAAKIGFSDGKSAIIAEKKTIAEQIDIMELAEEVIDPITASVSEKPLQLALTSDLTFSLTVHKIYKTMFD
ncbi:MAG: hypothetical protein LIO72_08320 [Ruminococcus sp.]|nr:hypothetical protein [Ruminococcus sp.]